jgi:hypothetical protein
MHNEDELICWKLHDHTATLLLCYSVRLQCSGVLIPPPLEAFVFTKRSSFTEPSLHKFDPQAESPTTQQTEQNVNWVLNPETQRSSMRDASLSMPLIRHRGV